MNDTEKGLLIVGGVIAAYLLLSPKNGNATPNSYSTNVPFYMSYNTPYYSGFTGAAAPLPQGAVAQDGMPIANCTQCDTCSLLPISGGTQF